MAGQARHDLGPEARPQQLVEVALSAQVVQADGGQQQGGVRDPVDDPDPQAVPRGSRPLLKEGDQQRGGQPDQFPAGEQRLDRAGQRRGDHAEHEQRVQDEEPVVTGSRCM